MTVAVDLSTVAVLAAISLSEGIGRVPAGALLLRRTLLGPWRVCSTPARSGRLKLVHWWPPMLETLVVPPLDGTAASLTGDEFQRRLISTTWAVRVARMVGAVTLIGLVLGIPLGIGIAGWVGGLLAAAGVVTGQVVLAVTGWRGLGLVGANRGAQWRLVALTLNPFAAPSVASRILTAAAAGVSQLTVVRALLPRDAWTSWFRPRAYDARVTGPSAEQLSQELEDADAAIVDALGQTPPVEGDDRWCPRCGATYQAGFTTCAECEVPLEGAEASPSRNSKC